MSEIFRMSRLTTSEATPSAISLPASAGGAAPSGLPDGLTTDLFGLVVVPVSRSRALAKGRVSTIPVISGQRGFGSSASAALASCLESRLRVRMGSHGSILWRLTWKASLSPSGRRIFRLRASKRSLNDSAFGSWPAPRAKEAGDYTYSRGDHHSKTLTLSGAVKLAHWPAPQARDGNGQGASLNRVGGRRRNLDDYARTGGSQSQQVRLIVPGETPNGSTAPTTSIGQLNPAHSRWLMGYPAVWDACAPTATRSSRKSRRSSSGRT